MNDETREQLSAYLDGALPEAERRALEARLSASAELRGALEDLRAVSNAVKNLPKEPLPPGFHARLQARRARGETPRRDWVFLPPAARPVVAALSCGVVALMIWDKVAVPPEQALLHPPEAAKVMREENAPASQLNFSGAASGAAGSLSSLDKNKAASDAKSLDLIGPASVAASQGDESPLVDERRSMHAKKAAFMGAAGAVRGGSARASGAPIDAELSGAGTYAEPQLTDRTRPQMTEEERSHRNEELIGALEKQKQDMGMKVLPKGEDGVDANAVGYLGLREPPAAPKVRAPVPALLQAKAQALGTPAAAPPAAVMPASSAAPGRLAADAGLVFTDAGSLSSSWVLLGMPGDPPSTDFSAGRLVMIKPSATKILSVTPGPDAVSVVYRSLLPDEASNPAQDRVAPLPLEPKAVLIYDATPR